MNVSEPDIFETMQQFFLDFFPDWSLIKFLMGEKWKEGEERV